MKKLNVVLLLATIAITSLYAADDGQMQKLLSKYITHGFGYLMRITLK